MPLAATVAQGQWDYYRFDATPGRTMLFTLDGEAGSAAMYVRRTLPPTLSSYDASGSLPNQTDQELRLLDPVAGTYYLGVFQSTLGGGSGSYTLSADLTSLNIRKVTPDEVGNAGTATIKILGDGFSPNAEVQLVASDGAVIDGDEYRQDSATLFATFDVASANAQPGVYDVVVVNPSSGVVTHYDAVTVWETSQTGFEAEVRLPAITRPGRSVNVIVTYSNTGLTDIPSPVLQLDGAEDDFAWRLPGDGEWIEGSEVRFLAVSSDGPPTLLRPGQSETIVVQMRTPFRAGPYNVELFSLGAPSKDGSAKAIDWDAVEADAHPEDIDPQTWNTAFETLKTVIGSTWTDYAVFLSDAFERWHAAGAWMIDADKLLRSKVDDVLERPARIMSGTVVSAETSQPIAGAVVTAQSIESEGNGQATTDDDGRFVIYGLGVGSLQVGVGEHLIESATNLIIPTDGDLLNADLQVVDAGHATGLVKDAVSGGGLPNVLVTIENESGDFFGSVLTNQLGQYRFGELPPGSYAIRSSVEGYFDAHVEGILVGLGITRRVELIASPGAILTGTVRDADDGSELSGALVTITGQATGTYLAVVASASGNFEFTMIPPGRYEVAVSLETHLQHDAIEWDVADDVYFSVLDISLDPGATVLGTILDSQDQTPLMNVVIRLTSASDSARTLEATTDENGLYSISGIDEGDWLIETEHPDFVRASTSIVAIVGSESREMSLNLDRGASITGTVLNVSGDPLADVTVVMHVSGEHARSVWAASNAQGEYRLAGLPAGQYTLTFEKPGFVTQRTDTVVLSPAQTLAGLSVTLDEAASLMGTVVNAEGTPVANAHVSLVSSDDIRATASTDEQGNWEIHAFAPGIYYMTASASGFAAFHQMIEIPVNGSTENVVSSLVEGAVISGHIFALAGEPVAGATVFAFDQRDHIAQFATSSDDGSFRMEDLLPGTYAIRILHETSVFDDADLILGIGEVTDRTFVTAKATVEVTVTDATDGKGLVGTVFLMRRDESVKQQQILALPTDSDGAAQFPSVPSGNYVVYAHDDVSRAAVGELAVVASGSFNLHLQAEAAYPVEGTIRNVDNEQIIAEATIRIRTATANPLIDTLFSVDDQGYFVSPPLPEDDYRISVASPGYGISEETIHVSAPSVHDVNLSPQGFTLDLSVVDAANSLPLFGAQVIIRFKDMIVARGEAGASGVLTFWGLAPGDYTIHVRFFDQQAEFSASIEGDHAIEIPVPLNGENRPGLREAASANLGGTTADSGSGGLSQGDPLSAYPTPELEWLLSQAKRYAAFLREINDLKVAVLNTADAINSLPGRVTDAVRVATSAANKHSYLKSVPVAGLPSAVAFPRSLPALAREFSELHVVREDLPQWKKAVDDYLAVPEDLQKDWDNSSSEYGRIKRNINSHGFIVAALEYAHRISEFLSLLTGSLTEIALDFLENQVFPAYTHVAAVMAQMSGALQESNRFLTSFNTRIGEARGLDSHLERWGTYYIEKVDAYNTRVLKFERDIVAAESQLVQAIGETNYSPAPPEDSIVAIRFNVLKNERATSGALPHADNPIVRVDWVMVPAGATVDKNGDFTLITSSSKDVYALYRVSASANGKTVKSPNVALLSVVIGDPDPPKEDEGDGENKTSRTPEDKFGPGGYDSSGTTTGSESRYVVARTTLDYRIEFWNKPDAEVPTQDAVIIDRLDPAVFDVSTLEITRVGFLNWDLEVSSRQVVDARIDTRPEMNIAVEIRAGLGMQIPGFANNADIDENTLVFWFHAIDPETGQWPEDPMEGFLPPYNPETGFEIGWVEYTLDPVEGLASGTQLSNVAYVEFDFAGDIYDHPAPKADPDVEPAEAAPWINTVDAAGPTSQVESLPAATRNEVLAVRWSGQDDAGGSGVASYDIYVAMDDGAFGLWLNDTTETEALFVGSPGHKYAFYSVATDNVGHREDAPLTADAQTSVIDESWHNSANPFDVDGVDGVTPADVLTIINYINSHPGDVSLPAPPSLPPPYLDVNGDNQVSAADVLAIINFINGGIAGGEAVAARPQSQLTAFPSSSQLPATSAMNPRETDEAAALLFEDAIETISYAACTPAAATSPIEASGRRATKVDRAISELGDELVDQLRIFDALESDLLVG